MGGPMKDIWQQSPDGRATAVDPDLGRPVDHLEPAAPADPKVRELEPFLQACVSVFPEPLEKGRPRLGFFLFALGAADRFWGLYGLDDRRFPPYAESLLRRFGASSEQAATLVAALPQVPADPFAGQALSEGGEALETWLRSRDSNVALRLTELVADWRRI